MALWKMDTTRFPLVVITVPAVVTKENIDAHCERLENDLFSLGRYAAIVDARLVDGDRFSAPLRRYAGQKYAEHDAQARRLAISEAYVLTSAMQRGVLTAIRWIQPPPWATKNFATMEEAEAWSRERIAADPKR